MRSAFLLAIAACVGCICLYAAVASMQQQPTTWREQVIERCVAEGLLTRAGCELGYDATEEHLHPPAAIDERPQWSAL